MNSKVLNDIINWDVHTWKQVLPLWEQQLANYDKTTSVCVEIGSRDGGLTLWMALNGFTITCSDNHYDLTEAKILHSEYKIINGIEYKKIDLINWQEENKYDIIILKSVFGALQNEESIKIAVGNIYNNLKKGGVMLFAENSKSTYAHQALRKYCTDWGRLWFYFDEKFTKELLKKFEVVDIRFNGVLAIFGSRVGMSYIFSMLDKFVLNRIAPNRVKYMLFGYAKK